MFNKENKYKKINLIVKHIPLIRILSESTIKEKNLSWIIFLFELLIIFVLSKIPAYFYLDMQKYFCGSCVEDTCTATKIFWERWKKMPDRYDSRLYWATGKISCPHVQVGLSKDELPLELEMEFSADSTCFFMVDKNYKKKKIFGSKRVLTLERIKSENERMQSLDGR